MLQKRIQLRIDEEVLAWLKAYSQKQGSTTSEVFRNILENLKRREERRNRKTVRVQETSRNQFTLF